MSREIPTEKFNLFDLDEMTLKRAKEYIDKHWIILSSGEHALLSCGKIMLYDKATAKSLYFNRMHKDIQTYYFNDKKDILDPIFDVNEDPITKEHLNMCSKLKHVYKPYEEFDDDIKRRVELFISYQHEIVCDNRKDVLDHLLKLQANIVRGKKNDVCIYLKGMQGIGKSTLPEFFQQHVLNKDMCVCTGSGPLRKQFNSEFRGKTMVILEELENMGANDWIWISSTLKRFITGETIQIETKGKDPYEQKNLITFWLLSNHDAVRDDDGRRYFILPVSTKRMGDHEYFGNLRRQCFNDDVAHAYYCYLMEIDLGSKCKGDLFKPQAYPETGAKSDAYVSRLDPVFRFLKDTYILHKKGIDRIPVVELHNQYTEYCLSNKCSYKSKILFNRQLNDINIKHYKSGSKYYYKVSHEDLKQISDKLHWVHKLDEYIDDDVSNHNEVNGVSYAEDHKELTTIIKELEEALR